jgi:hypothetical protein
MTLQLLRFDFLIYEENSILFFISVGSIEQTQKFIYGKSKVKLKRKKRLVTIVE